MKLLYYCDATRRSKARSGIHRVIVEAGRALEGMADVDFVVWDDLQGQLRYANEHDLQAVFVDTDFVASLKVNPNAGRVSYRFGETVANPGATWLLYPEIAYHTDNGNERYSRILAQCRDYRIPVASVLYDVIPISEPGYDDIRQAHTEYVKYLCGSDAILPISTYSGETLIDWLRQEKAIATDAEAALRAAIHPVRLGEIRAEDLRPLTRRVAADDGAPLRIISVGTIEPRKQQTRFLRVLNELATRHPRLREARVDLFGSLHPACAADLSAAVAANRNIVHHGYSTDSEIRDCYASADFSFFVSKSEGFGLPIVESLRNGVPCLCADFGAMAEVAEGGGCHMVDVTRDEAIAAGLLKLAEDADYRGRLRDEAAGRHAVTWTDYARAVLDRLEALNAARDADRERCVRALCTETRARTATGINVELDTAIVCRPDAAATPDLAAGLVRGVLLDTIPPTDAVAGIAGYDSCAVASAEIRDGLYRAWGQDAAGMLPPRILVPETSVAAALREQLARTLVDRAGDIARLRMIAAREAMFGQLGRTLTAPLAPRKPALAIVISTYNRAAFVAMNVEWLLEITAPHGDDIRVIVIDNASTDDTLDRLQRFAGNPHLQVRRNNANTGMLGNLNVCSQLEEARHVWITGDDDFIQPDVLAKVLAAVKADPELPVAITNFGVYHRFQPGEFDKPENYAKEATLLAPKCLPDGRYWVRTIAEQHDNLFTAVYPIVWRSDILAACFNYPFTGIPFADLVECVPTTKQLLESYSFVEAAWFADMGTVGNAHNSWTRHRPRWHGLIMPQVLELARDVGVDARILHDWSKVHVRLYDEAIGIAQASDLLVHLDEEDLEVPLRVFGTQLAIPDTVRRFKDTRQLIDWWGSNDK
ncbi:glycosyltransferase [Polymorphum gilvum]|uniref:Glycosyl transferase group 1 n=1 Tax=Polymorphum gilvum (strain LMG 25793 / CGMCC 1.9160 / SL003B-26A1) TaxID=991905 RepID=F2J3F6_POLGS|nr:glycosyltransferase [Polymorphum gilvum]ADZ70981.1 Glycosyl transferase group 1 [Polymorphum gilvum SL003B-26A1]